MAFTQTEAQIQVLLDAVEDSNTGLTGSSDLVSTVVAGAKKSGFHALGASSASAPSTDRSVMITAARGTAAGEIRYGQIVLTESNGLWFNVDDGGVLGTWFEAASTAGTQTLTDKTLTAPVIATIVNTGTLTLPTSTDTLVGRVTTDTLTNKTLTSPVLTGATLDGVLGGVVPAAATITTLTASGIVSVDDTTESTSTITGSIHTDGGLGVVKNTFLGGTATVTGLLTASAALTVSSGSLTVTGGTLALRSTDSHGPDKTNG